MKITDIQNDKNQSLILFFNGWGFDEGAIAHLKTEMYDVKSVHDYRTIEPIDNNIIKGYSAVTVIAWSFGVWVANVALCNIASSITKAYAINGTCCPVDDYKGIPKSIFDGTVKTLTENSYRKFQERIMGGAANMKTNSAFLPKRNFSEQKDELLCLAEHFTDQKPNGINWDSALCGTLDRICPFDNQKLFWGEKAIEKPLPHFIFNHFTTWDELLNEFING